MQLLDYITSQWHTFAAGFKYPIFLWGIPILLFILLILITRNFVRYSMDPESKGRLRRMRVFVFIMRFLALALVCIALAAPFTEITKETAGDPHATVLVDRSGSMNAYDTYFVSQLTNDLNARLPTKVKEFGSSEESPIGDAILSQDTHVLVISDGYPTTGVQLLDVAQVFKENNLSINTVSLRPLKDDAAVYIDAPDSVPVGYPVTITVTVSAIVPKAVPLTVTIDDKVVYSAPTIGAVSFTPPLATGYHKIAARIESKDSHDENNEFYRVVHVLDKPKILVLAKSAGPLEQALGGLFDVTMMQQLPSDATQLASYYAIVVDDMPANKVGNTKALTEFLRDEQGGKYGAGLVVIGGFNSFDRGGYGATPLEAILPVKTGKPKRTLGDNNIVFVIQVSGSTSGKRIEIGPGGTKTEVTDTEPTIDIIKAQAVSAINSLNLKNNVGVIAFGVSNEGKSYDSAEQALAASVVTISDIKPLYSNKQEITDKIPRIVGGGTTAPDVAIRAAVDLLKDKSGDKTIILLTNGRFSAGIGEGNDVPAKANTLALIDNAKKRYGIKTQTLGVGTADDTTFPKKVDEAFLKLAATTGDSNYDRATNMMHLLIQYGDPKEKGFGDNFNLACMSRTHFITKDVGLCDIDYANYPVLNGYNEVAPKEGARMLVATDSGAPAVTVWNYFNGRVAAITVFTASGLGPLLGGNNSDLIRNTVLWAVGDPARKQELNVQMPMGIIGKPTQVTFTSAQPLSGDCKDTPLTFERSSGDTYVFSFTPAQRGFGTACGVPYATNEPAEWWRVGMNEDLKIAAGVTNGGVFEPEQVDAIVEKIRTESKKVTIEKTELRNPFLVIALILFLLEIFIRRLVQYQR